MIDKCPTRFPRDFAGTASHRQVQIEPGPAEKESPLKKELAPVTDCRSSGRRGKQMRGLRLAGEVLREGFLPVRNSIVVLPHGIKSLS